MTIRTLKGFVDDFYSNLSIEYIQDKSSGSSTLISQLFVAKCSVMFYQLSFLIRACLYLSAMTLRTLRGFVDKNIEPTSLLIFNHQSKKINGNKQYSVEFS